MSFEIGVGDIIAVSGLAIAVSIAYQDALDDCKHISEEVASLRILIDKFAQHLRSTSISSHDHCYGQKVFKGCQNVLEDLKSLIQKYKRLASINERLVLTGVKLGKENIVTLRARLISYTVLLKGFVQRFVPQAFYFIIL